MIPDNLAEQWDAQDADEERKIQLTAAWNEPGELPSDMPAVPELQPEMLPEAFRDHVIDISERIGCPLEFPTVAILVALSSVVGRQVGIRPNEFDTWTAIPNLWGASVGLPGSLKSPAQSEALKALDRLEAEARRKYEREKADYDAEQIVAKQQTRVTDEAVKAALKEGNRDEAMRLSTEAKSNEPTPPQRKRYKTQDATVEKLGELLAENPNGIAIIRDELMGWLRQLDKQGHETDRAFYLEAWNGDSGFTCDRIGRGTLDIDGACVAILGTIQPGPLQSYVNEANRNCVGADGLLQRFQLMVWPDPPKAWKHVDRKPDIEARQRVFEVFERLSDVRGSGIETACYEDRDFLYFLHPARREFQKFRESLENRLIKEKMDPSMHAVLAKQRSLVPSLAGLFHLTDYPEGGPIREDSVLRAIAWAGYLEEHAKRIFGYASNGADYSMRQLAEKIKDGSLQKVFRKSDVYRNHWSGLDTAEKAELALHKLELIGWVKKLDGKTNGRPREEYRINPKVMPTYRDDEWDRKRKDVERKFRGAL